MSRALRAAWAFGLAAAAAAIVCAAVVSATTLQVPAGGDLQSALLNAQPGDTIVPHSRRHVHGKLHAARQRRFVLHHAPDKPARPAGARRAHFSRRSAPAREAALAERPAGPSDGAGSSSLAHCARRISGERRRRRRHRRARQRLGVAEHAHRRPEQPDHRPLLHSRRPLAGPKARGGAQQRVHDGRRGPYISDIKVVGQDSRRLAAGTAPGPS